MNDTSRPDQAQPSHAHANSRSGLSSPRLCGLLGVKPSTLSQSMHNAGYRALGLPFTYVAFDTTNTDAGITAMRELGIRGLSLTIPHKEQALGLVDQLSNDAIQIGAINTVVNEQGELFGYNTDWYGVVEAFRERGVQPKQAMVFGAGGAARAAIIALGELGCKSVLIANRTDRRAQELADIFNCQSLAFAKLTEFDFSSVDTFINASPAFEEGTDAGYPFSFSVFGPGHAVLDMVTRDTPLFEKSQAQGATAIHGIRMLLHQAVKQFELFTQATPPLGVLEHALLSEYQAVKRTEK